MDELHVDNLIREVNAAAENAGPEPVFPHLVLQQLVPLLREHHHVEPRPPLIGRTRYERLWVHINQILRRVAAHAVEPAVAQQNEFNTALLDALEQCMRADAELRASVVILRAKAEERVYSVSGTSEAD
jgi:hypothetical protein